MVRRSVPRSSAITSIAVTNAIPCTVIRGPSIGLRMLRPPRGFVVRRLQLRNFCKQYLECFKHELQRSRVDQLSALKLRVHLRYHYLRYSNEPRQCRGERLGQLSLSAHATDHSGKAGDDQDRFVLEHGLVAGARGPIGRSSERRKSRSSTPGRRAPKRRNHG